MLDCKGRVGSRDPPSIIPAPAADPPGAHPMPDDDVDLAEDEFEEDDAEIEIDD